MTEFLNYIIAKIQAVWQWVSDMLVAVFEALWLMIKDAFVWVFDQFLGLVVSALNGINPDSVPDISQYWGQLPAQMLDMLAVMGFDVALGIVFAALVVRFALQLIPFIRLGS